MVGVTPSGNTVFSNAQLKHGDSEGHTIGPGSVLFTSGDKAHCVQWIEQIETLIRNTESGEATVLSK
jgi:hypothetical protein